MITKAIIIMLKTKLCFFLGEIFHLLIPGASVKNSLNQSEEYPWLFSLFTAELATIQFFGTFITVIIRGYILATSDTGSKL